MHKKLRRCAIPLVSIFTVVFIAVSACSLAGCRTGINEAKFSSSTDASDTDASAAASTAPSLAWDPPATYTDGSPLTDLKEYRVYFSASPSPYSSGSYYTVPPSTTSVKVRDVISTGTGTYFIVVTAVDASNIESDPSNVTIKYLY